VILDPIILADLAVTITPKSYVRVTPMAHAATPLGAGFGVTRFASPRKTFKVIYIAQDLTTGIAETLVRDRFQGRARRRLLDVEATRGKAQGQGRKLSQAIYHQTDAQGLIYNSRLTGRTCICLYQRALPGGLVATPVVELTLLAGFVDALRELNVTLFATP